MPFIALFFLFVLQLETSILGLLHFVGRGAEGLWYPLIVFGSITVGNGINLLLKKDDAVLKYAFHILALPLIVFFASLRFFPQFYLPLSLPPFVAIGMVMAALYAQRELWNLVLSFVVSGLIFYAGLFFASSWLAEFQFAFLFANLFLLAFASQSALVDKILAGVVTASLVGLFHAGYFEVPSRLHQVLANYKDVRQLAKPRLTGLFRTDMLYLNQKDLLILQANGIRFAMLPSKSFVESQISEKRHFSPSHDSPYTVTQPKKVLVIGPAEGANVISALAAGVKDIWTVDINPSMYDFSLNEARSYTGGFYDRPEVHRIVDEGRHFLETTDQSFDLITLQGVQTGSQASLESSALIESYLFTNEALEKLWDRLTPTGLLYLEEYRNFFSQIPVDDGKSLLSVLGHSAMKILPIDDPQQVRLISYDQSSKNPNSRDSFRRRREALFISKTKISDESLKKALSRIGDSARVETIDPNVEKDAITDDRPMFLTASLAEHQTGLLLTGLGIFACLLGFSIRSKQRVQSAELLVIGVVYMLFVMAISGPASLILGHPGYVAPIVYGSLLGGSLIGAWIVLKLKGYRDWMEFALLAFLVVCAVFHSPIKDWLIGVDSTALRFATILFIGLLFGMLIELPYVRLLNQVEGWNRAYRFFIENAGTVLAVPLGIWLQAYFGLAFTLYTCVVLGIILIGFRFLKLEKGKS